MVDASTVVSADRRFHRPPDAHTSFSPDRHSLLLDQLVRLEIVPRLCLSRRFSPVATKPPAHHETTSHEDQIEELTRLVLANGADGSLDYVEQLFKRGTSIERLYLGLIASVARHLHDLWLADVCSFMNVTLGLWRLQQVVRKLSPIFQQGGSAQSSRYQALLVPLPGEQHTFGLYLVAEFFRRAGWSVCSMPLKAADELVAIVRNEWFTSIGLSMSCEYRLEELARQIHIIRRVSCNHEICVMVGGAIFIEHPELVSQVGADLMAVDGREAPANAQNFVESRRNGADTTAASPR
jgi:MerR family transcriptional regulator, light-induced transcriptional regulator